jgi:hypothetical protein
MPTGHILPLLSSDSYDHANTSAGEEDNSCKVLLLSSCSEGLNMALISS